MIEAGALDGVDEAYAVHIAPPLPPGMLASRAGALMASSTPFEIQLSGTGGHGADATHGVVDAAAQIALDLSAISGVLSATEHTAMVSVGVVRAGEASNVQPTTGVLEGTLRAFDVEGRREAMQAVEQRIAAASEKMGVVASLRWPGPDAPVMMNDATAYETARVAGQTVVGASQMLEFNAPIGASEDFALVGERVPSAVVFVGSGGSGSVHAPTLEIDESCLSVGAALYAEIALRATARAE